jgi:hypothetical protein
MVDRVTRRFDNYADSDAHSDANIAAAHLFFGPSHAGLRKRTSQSR